MATGVIFPEGAFPAGLFAGFPKYGTLEIDDPPTITKYKGCIELNQIEGTTKKHPIQVLDSLEVPVEELVNPIVYCRVNRGIMSTEEFDISEYDEYFQNYDIQIPYSIQAHPLSAGDTVEVVIADAGVGYGKIIINVIPDHTNFATVTAVDAEKIVPADKYAFDASAKTLTFSSPYDTLTVEQVTFIKNLTTNYIIWDCRYAGYQTLPVRFGAAPDTNVLSFDSADLDAANTDKIMIVVNQV